MSHHSYCPECPSLVTYCLRCFFRPTSTCHILSSCSWSLFFVDCALPDLFRLLTLLVSTAILFLLSLLLPSLSVMVFFFIYFPPFPCSSVSSFFFSPRICAFSSPYGSIFPLLIFLLKQFMFSNLCPFRIFSKRFSTSFVVCCFQPK